MIACIEFLFTLLWIAFWTALVCFAAWLLLRAGRWLRDRWRWLKWFSWN